MLDDLHIPDDFEPAARPASPEALPDLRTVESLVREAGPAPWAAALLRTLAERHGDALVLRSFAPGASLPRALRARAPEASWLRRFLTDRDLDAAVQAEWLRQGFLADDPTWLTRLLERDEAQIARLFLLSGNTADYAFDPVAGYRPALRVLADALARAKDAVLTVSLGRGIAIRAQDEATEERLRTLLEGWGFPELRFDPAGALVAQVGRLLDALRRWLEADGDNLPGGLAFVFENAHLVFTPGAASLDRHFLLDTLLSWSTRPALFHSPHCVVLVAEFLGDVASELRAAGGKVDEVLVERPATPEGRLKFILPLVQSGAGMRETRIVRQPHGLRLGGYEGRYVEQLRALAHDTAGLSFLGIEDVAQEALLGPARTLARADVLRAKRERLQEESGGLLDVIHPRRTLDDLAGYAPLKQRLREIVASLRRADDPLARATTPMGLLFLGPPGTGKTIAAEAVATESGVNMVRLGDFRGMYVGQSERNLTRLLRLLEALYPVIVFMDELDQTESRGQEGDSGVSKRIFGRLLQFMSDTRHRGRILWIGASNRPDALDDALKRAGRFDVVLPFLLPDAESRARIFETLLHARAATLPIEPALEADDYRQLAARTEGFSGAEIELVLGEVLHRAARRRAATPVRVGMDAVRAVLDEYLPPRARHEYAAMEALARDEVRFRSLLPDGGEPTGDE